MSVTNGEVADQSHIDMYGHLLHPSAQDAASVLYPSYIFNESGLAQWIGAEDLQIYSIDSVEASSCDFAGDLHPGFTYFDPEPWNERWEHAAEAISTHTQGFREFPVSSSAETLLASEGTTAQHDGQGDLAPSQQSQQHSSQEDISHGNTLGVASSQTTSYQCLFSGCDARPFRRAADLDRHWRHTHANSTVERFPCDYRRCERHSKPFTRRDHYRDHYRIYHNEDILRRGVGSMSPKPSVSRKWWRCGKCLVRVNIANDEWQCRLCNTSCELERRRLRGYLAGQ